MPRRVLRHLPLEELFRQRDDLVGLPVTAQLLKQLEEAAPLGTLDKETIAKAIAAYGEAERVLCKSETDKQTLSDAVLGALFVGVGIAGTPLAESLQEHQRNAGRARYAQSDTRRHLDEILKDYAARRFEFKSIDEAAEHYEREYQDGKTDGPTFDTIRKHIKEWEVKHSTG